MLSDSEIAYDKLVIDDVEKAIESIGDVSLLDFEDAQMVVDIRKKYDGLTIDRQGSVKNYSKLKEAEDILLPLAKANVTAIDFMNAIKKMDYDKLTVLTDEGRALENNEFTKRLYLNYIRDKIARGVSVDFQKLGSFQSRYNGLLDYDEIDNYICKSKIDELAKIFREDTFYNYEIKKVSWDGNIIKAIVSVDSEISAIDTMMKDDGVAFQSVVDQHIGDYLDKHATEYKVYAQGGGNTLLYMLEMDYYLNILPGALDEVIGIFSDPSMKSPDKKEIQLYIEEKNGEMTITKIVGF